MDVLAVVIERAQAVLASDTAARAFLRDQSAGNEALWRSYGLGAAQRGLLDDAQVDTLRASGILSRKGPNPFNVAGVLLPTRDPRSSEHITGVIRITPRSNQHGFVTAPSGLGLPATLQPGVPLLLVDNPLIALRMAQAGIPNAAVVEAPAVLEPLRSWLLSWEVVLVSCKKRCLENLKRAVGAPQAGRCRTLLVPSYATSFDPGVFGGPDAPTPEVVLPLHRLAEYGQARIRAGEGCELLDAFGLADAELVRAYGMGFLPADFSKALDQVTRRTLPKVLRGKSLIVPAYDEAGGVVDLLVLHRGRKGFMAMGLFDTPRGLLAPRVTTSFERLAVVDGFEALSRAWSVGERGVLYLRGEPDARLNAERLYRSGVRSVRIDSADAEPLAAALAGAGLVIERGDVEAPEAESIAARAPEILQLPAQAHTAEPAESVAQAEPAPTVPAALPEAAPESSVVPGLTLAGYDPKAEEARFTLGDAVYLVEVAIDSGTRLQIRLERGGKTALDRFDLASEQQRRRYAQSAALRTGVPYEEICEHLLAILDAAKRIQAERQQPGRPKKAVIEVSGPEREAALAFLRREDLLDAIAADLDALGWVGEERNKKVLTLTAASRKLTHPLSVVLRAQSGGGKSIGLETVALLTPPEDLLHVSRLTESSLYYADEDALRHKLLVFDETDAIGTDVMTHLRVLQTRGVLSQSYTDRDPATGQVTTRYVEARGPVAVLMSTTGALDEQNLSRCFDLDIDESEGQTKRIQGAQRRLRADPGYHGKDGLRERLVRRHRNVQRLLAKLPVLIPFADRIEFPSGSVKHRREHERFLNLIESSALLHQHRRMRQKSASGEEYVVADERDFACACALAAPSVARASDDLSAHARELLDLLVRENLRNASLGDLSLRRPGWTRHRLYSALEELTRLEYLTSTRGRGKVRLYEVQAQGGRVPTATIRLRPVVEVVGGPDNNFAPSVATG